MKKWRVPFTVRKLERRWCVLEHVAHANGEGLALVSYWSTRDQAREAARQLNQEERRYG